MSTSEEYSFHESNASSSSASAVPPVDAVKEQKSLGLKACKQNLKHIDRFITQDKLSRSALASNSNRQSHLEYLSPSGVKSMSSWLQLLLRVLGVQPMAKPKETKKHSKKQSCGQVIWPLEMAWLTFQKVL
jgi:hypothetical protein